MRKQPVKTGILYIGSKQKIQKGGAFPLAMLAAPILRNIDGVI